MCELYPGEFEAMEHNGRMDAIEPMYYPQVDGITPTVVAEPVKKNTVSEEAYKQVMWERDIAIQQLKELGYGFGEKPEMGDTISKQAAIKYLMDNMTWYSEDGYETDEDEKKSAITSLINGVPSIQPVTGKWILEIEDWNKWTCSQCGWSERTDIHVMLGYNYCPNCGAKMFVPQEKGGRG